MKKIALMMAIGLTLTACNNDDNGTSQPAQASVSLSFNHNFNGSTIENADFDQIKYTNENGEQMSISKLVYLISDVTFTDASGNVVETDTYNLVDVRNNSNLTFSPLGSLEEGTYTVSFTYGFDDEDNAENYADLNSADGTWVVPDPLGGGYHYMRLEGKYINTASEEIGYQFHNVRANRHDGMPLPTGPLETRDTSITVNLGQIEIEGTTTIGIDMDVAEWFKNPNTWNLNEDFEILMPKWEKQLEMNENGQNVFSLGTVESVSTN